MKPHTYNVAHLTLVTICEWLCADLLLKLTYRTILWNHNFAISHYTCLYVSNVISDPRKQRLPHRQAIQTYILAFHVKWEGWLLISLHTWHHCYYLPASLSEVAGILHGSFFNVLCKSCGEITQARSPPFETDGKPFQRDYDALDLLSFSFLLKPRYQLSVSRALDCLDRGAHVLAHPSPESGWNSPLWPLCVLPFTAVRQHNDMMVTFQMHLNSALLGLVTTITPTQEKAL